MSKILIIFLLLFPLSSCRKGVGEFLPARPSSEFNFGDEVSPEFKQGWDSGCEVGMKSGSNTFYQVFYRNNVADGYKMASSTDYKNAWGLGFWFCYRDDWVRQKSSIWGSMMGGYR